jgi:hypothetical protein
MRTLQTDENSRLISETPISNRPSLGPTTTSYGQSRPNMTLTACSMLSLLWDQMSGPYQTMVDSAAYEAGKLREGARNS